MGGLRGCWLGGVGGGSDLIVTHADMSEEQRREQNLKNVRLEDQFNSLRRSHEYLG